MSTRRTSAGLDGLAAAYFKLLSSIDWRDEVLVAGLREGLNKFLSNAHLASFRGNKYHKTHYASPEALRRLQSAVRGGLVWEHLVPKEPYIQRPCEDRAQKGTLTLAFIRDLLDRYWYLATITAEENQHLPRLTMPADWDERDVLARYEAAGLTLVPNPYFDRLAGEDGASRLT